MTVNELRDFIFKNIINELDLFKKAVIIQWNIWKKGLLLLATKLIEKIVAPSNAKEYYNSYSKRKDTGSVNDWK